MFVLKRQLPRWIGKQVKVVGSLSRVETSDIVFSTYDGDVRIASRDLHKYTDRMVIVTGTVMENLKIAEECVDNVPDGFCLETYAGMVRLSEHFPEIF